VKVLVADDDAISSRLLARTLSRWGYEVVMVHNGQAALEILLGKDPPCLAILDWVMPGLDGGTICKRVRQERVEPYIYIILLTMRHEKQDMISGLELGADDYIAKPFDPDELRVRVSAGRRIVELQAQLMKAREELRLRALTDPLTQLWNHTAIIQRLEEELSRSRREGNEVLVGMLDVDHFKKINDTYGHRIGDAVLYEVAQRLRSALRPYDSIGRYGGEEFLIVAPGNPHVDPNSPGRRFCSVMRAHPFRAGGLQLRVTASVGLAVWRPEAAVTLEQLIQQADEALYWVKRNGRDGYAVYSAVASVDSVVARCKATS
jgi:two-component system cell cycle response regulator